jgi:1-deoxy-D-xylulose-5-phosphate reductoisomerase
MRALSVLGSTGSIGTATLAIVASFPDRFRVVGLAAGRNLGVLRSQLRAHRPAVASVASRADAEQLAAEFPDTRFVAGDDGLVEVACHDDADLVVAALVGSIGLPSAVAAVRAGKHLALANKETLVVAGEIVMRAAAESGVEVLPIDSEHCALHQALAVGPEASVRRLILTASGGPFLRWPEDRMLAATVEDALAHPTWRMGPKITIDSATMMNKGLEIIEAHHLFSMPGRQIEVLVHPQSIVHSLVEYVDGSILAQLSVNDMRVPIQYALSWPDRLPTPLEPLDLTIVGELSFEAVDRQRFPATDLARAALEEGGEMPAVLNAANEVAVQAFLDRRCGLAAIIDTVAATMQAWQPRNRALDTVEQALAVDDSARRLAEQWLGNAARRQGGSVLRW